MRGKAFRGLASSVAVAALTLAPLIATGGPAGAADPFELLMADTDTGLHPMRWNPCQTSITYKVNTFSAREDGRGNAAARARAREEIIGAVTQIDRLTGITFKYTGTTHEIPTGEQWWDRQGPQDEVVIAYAKNNKAASRSSLLQGDAWGQGGQVYMYEDDTVVIGRGFVVLDSSKARTMRPGFGPGARRGNLVLHELGHVMGLDHVSNPHLLMNPMLTHKTPDGFAAGERAGLAKLGTEAGCIDGAEDFWPGS